MVCQTPCLLLWHILSSPFSRPERLLLFLVLKVILIVRANALEHLCVTHCAEHLTCISASSDPHPSLGGSLLIAILQMSKLRLRESWPTVM